jgi:hypothetical protein
VLAGSCPGKWCNLNGVVVLLVFLTPRFFPDMLPVLLVGWSPLSRSWPGVDAASGWLLLRTSSTTSLPASGTCADCHRKKRAMFAQTRCWDTASAATNH